MDENNLSDDVVHVPFKCPIIEISDDDIEEDKSLKRKAPNLDVSEDFKKRKILKSSALKKEFEGEKKNTTTKVPTKRTYHEENERDFIRTYLVNNISKTGAVSPDKDVTKLFKSSTDFKNNEVISSMENSFNMSNIGFKQECDFPKTNPKTEFTAKMENITQIFEPAEFVTKTKFGTDIWESIILSKWSKIDFNVARNVINMLGHECTVPFIARYRREKTNNMDADKLRHVKNCYENIKALEKEARHVVKKIEKAGQLNPKLEETIYNVESLEELEFIYEPYKKTKRKSLADRAKALGLADVSQNILHGVAVDIKKFVDINNEALDDEKKVLKGIENILCDIFAKDEGVIDTIRRIETQIFFGIKSIHSKPSEKTQKLADDRKFETYYDFETNANLIRPHQMLALNRGENLKILTVKFSILNESWLRNKLYKFCEEKWFTKGSFYSLRQQVFNNSFNYSFQKKIVPFIIRKRRSELNRKANQAAIENFASNLKSLLQTPPVKGCPILGIDPGWKNGFKFALISCNGDVLWTHVMHFDTHHQSKNNRYNMSIIKDILILNNCDIIAIGNGCGCRAMEKIISDFIGNKFFESHIKNLKYTIVNERGASIYSCSEIAKKEFPNLDPNLISAVYIARLLQDPLNEFVKVEPQHLGVGMYQHDINERQLLTTLNDIVMECVSFTGVDVNVASIHLLKRIAGLGDSLASNIVEWRQKNGPFVNRQQLLKVSRIGPKTFEQCSGFVRIHKQTVDNSVCLKSGSQEYNPLDCTSIHPEDYDVAKRFIEACGLELPDLGSKEFVNKIIKTVDENGISSIARTLNASLSKIHMIVESLMKPNDFDYRSQFSKPIFKQGVTDIKSVTVGMLITGVVENVTNFGAFVDIGVGSPSLLHTSQMKGATLRIGDHVHVEIINIEYERKRISLSFCKHL